MYPIKVLPIPSVALEVISRDRANRLWLKMLDLHKQNAMKFMKEDPWSWRTIVKNEDFKGQVLKQVYA